MVPLKRDDGSSNGVLYLYNHPDGISNVMRHKLDGVGAYLGTMVQNLEDKKIRVTQTVAIKMDTGGAEPYLEEGDRHARNSDILWENVGKPITDLESFLATTDAQ